MKKKDYLYQVYKIVKDQPSCDMPQCNFDYIDITYKNGKGHFKVLYYNLVCKFPQADYKKVISLLSEDNEGYNKAIELHDLYKSMSDKLIELKSKTKEADEKSEIQDALNRLDKLNKVLVDSFGIEELQTEKTIKMKTDICYKIIWNDDKKELVTDYKAKSFVKFGYKWYVSADMKIRGRKHIIIGSYGLSCCSFEGNIKQAIELVDDDLLNRVLKALEKSDNSDFLHMLNDNNIERVPDFKVESVIDVVNAIAEKENATIEEFNKQFEFDNDLLYDAEEINDKLDYSDKVKLFDNHIEEFKPIINSINQYRSDFISSDREAAAFIMAIDFFIKTKKKTIAGITIPVFNSA